MYIMKPHWGSLIFQVALVEQCSFFNNGSAGAVQLVLTLTLQKQCNIFNIGSTGTMYFFRMAPPEQYNSFNIGSAGRVQFF